MNHNSTTPENDNLYFDIQADFGITKHMGGKSATRRLAELCHVGRDTSLLVVGCGIGSSLVHLARQFGCQITAIDLSAGMIARATERVRQRGLEGQITLRVGDAQKLEFEKDHFDAVMSESVNAFLPDPARGMNEYTRVCKAGGYVGINEVTWTKPPSREIENFSCTIMAGARFRDAEGWKALLVNAGLDEIETVSYLFKASTQLRDELQMLEMGDQLKAMGRFLKGLVTNPAYRRFTARILSQLGLAFQFSRQIGYGLFVGRKVRN